MTTLLDVVADLEKLANDLKAIHGTIWFKLYTLLLSLRITQRN